MDFAAARDAMVRDQIAARGIGDALVLAAMGAVPREAFVAAGLADRAYEDCPLPIGSGQTISQPYIVALMIEAAEIGPDDHVLEIGAGSGYAAAILGRIARSVVAVERHADLATAAAARLRALGIDTVAIVCGDASEGWRDDAPYDAILAAAAAPAVSDRLIRQLAPGGRLIMPVGSRGAQDLQRLRLLSDGTVRRDSLGGVRFVPLIGRGGFDEGG